VIPDRRWVCTLTGWAVAIAGAITVFSVASPDAAGRLTRLERVVPLGAVHLSRVLAAVSGLVLVFLGRQLHRRKHRAWVMAVVLLIATSVLHILKGLDYEESVLSAVLVIVLLLGRRQFAAASDPPSLSTLLRVAPLYVLCTFGYGLIAIWFHRSRVVPSATPWRAVVSVAAGLIGTDGPLNYGGGLFAIFFPHSLLALGVVGLLGGLFLFFRPVVEGVRRHGADDLGRARGLVEAWGSDTLSYFALRSDKSFAFAEDGDAFIAYRYINGIAMMSGDPIGEPGACRRLLHDFVDDAHDRSWTVAVVAGREDLRPLYEAVGLHSYYLGDEAVIDPQLFNLEGRPIRKVRQSVHRLEKAGFTSVLLSDADATPELRSELDRVSSAWRKGTPERGFSMALGRVGSRSDPDCRILVLYDETSTVRGFLHMVPVYGDRPGFSLDAMRREPDVPNGATEFMICKAVEALRAEGPSRLSLNFAAFARLLSDDSALTRWEKIQRAVIKKFNPYFQIESLLTFNAKFFPAWVPRCIYYEERQRIPRIALSYLQLESFVRLPFGPALTGHPPDRRIRRPGPVNVAPVRTEPGSPGDAGSQWRTAAREGR
jgi:lysylphosphatidylglycerol synthetase-like protein (DUF2156 family)